MLTKREIIKAVTTRNELTLTYLDAALRHVLGDFMVLM